MIAAILAWHAVISSPFLSVVSYRQVPDGIVSVELFEWRNGVRPERVRLPSEISVKDGVADIPCRPGDEIIVSFVRGDGAYLVDGPFACPLNDGGRRVDSLWRRTFRLRVPLGGQPPVDVTWLSATDDRADGWPRCVWTGATAECWGVPIDARGVLTFGDSDRTYWTVLAGATPADFAGSAWARLVIVGNGSAAGKVVTSIAHAVPPRAERAAALRLDTAFVSDAHAMSVTANAVWIHGGQIPARSWIEVRGERTGAAYLALDEVALGPPTLPLWITLDEGRDVNGVALAGHGDVAAGTIVTLFRLIEPRPGPEGKRPPASVFAGERVADAVGAFHFGGLGDAEYEIVAWHPQFGRAVAAIPRGGGSIRIRLVSAGEVRGRVVASGKPLAGVDVFSLPDPDAYARAADLTDIKGGDGRTRADGRFVVSVAPGGGGEVRVGGGNYPIRRFPLPRAPLPTVDLGDIDLGSPIAVTIVLDRDPGCDVRATGPVGRAGLQVIVATRTGPGLFSVVFPEEGTWDVQLACGHDRRDEQALAPSVVTISRAIEGKELRFLVR